MTTSIYHHLADISSPFSSILLDAYGVFWGGNEVGVLPGCSQVMQNLVESGKTVGILSNSTQLAAKEEAKFLRHGLIRGKHYHFIITSGEVAKRIFSSNSLPFQTPQQRYVLSSPPHPSYASHLTLFEGSPFLETNQLDQADFVYPSIPHLNGQDQVDAEVFKNSLQAFYDANLPMVCANPDHFAHEGKPPKLVVRQGAVASIYESLGGQVFYIGKPSPTMFQVATEEFKHQELAKILMVGDTPETDIKGAKMFGIRSALILKTGMMAERIRKFGLEPSLTKLETDHIPTFFIQQLA